MGGEVNVKSSAARGNAGERGIKTCEGGGGRVGPKPDSPRQKAAVLFPIYPPHERLFARLGKQVRAPPPKTRVEETGQKGEGGDGTQISGGRGRKGGGRENSRGHANKRKGKGGNRDTPWAAQAVRSRAKKRGAGHAARIT